MTTDHEALIEATARAIFDARIHPGDVTRIRAKWDALTAYRGQPDVDRCRRQARAAFAVARPLIAQQRQDEIVDAIRKQAKRYDNYVEPDASYRNGMMYAAQIAADLPLTDTEESSRG